MATQQEKKWYVLRAMSQKESQVKDYIETLRKLGDLEAVSQVLVPQEKTVVVRNGRRVVKERTLMSGYVLVEARMTPEVASTLRAVPCVLGVLGGVSNPQPMKPQELARLLGEQTEGAGGEKIDFLVGEQVKVTEGPFSGFEGSIDKIDQTGRKLTVMVKVFGRNTPLILQFQQVQKIAP